MRHHGGEHRCSPAERHGDQQRGGERRERDRRRVGPHVHPAERLFRAAAHVVRRPGDHDSERDDRGETERGNDRSGTASEAGARDRCGGTDADVAVSATMENELNATARGKVTVRRVAIGPSRCTIAMPETTIVLPPPVAWFPPEEFDEPDDPLHAARSPPVASTAAPAQALRRSERRPLLLMACPPVRPLGFPRICCHRLRPMATTAAAAASNACWSSGVGQVENFTATVSVGPCTKTFCP